MTRDAIIRTFLDDYRSFCSGTTLLPVLRSADSYTLGYFASRCWMVADDARRAGHGDLADKILRARDAAHFMLGFGGLAVRAAA